MSPQKCFQSWGSLKYRKNHSCIEPANSTSWAGSHLSASAPAQQLQELWAGPTSLGWFFARTSHYKLTCPCSFLQVNLSQCLWFLKCNTAVWLQHSHFFPRTTGINFKRNTKYSWCAYIVSLYDIHIQIIVTLMRILASLTGDFSSRDPLSSLLNQLGSVGPTAPPWGAPFKPFWWHFDFSLTGTF